MSLWIWLGLVACGEDTPGDDTAAADTAEDTGGADSGEDTAPVGDGHCPVYAGFAEYTRQSWAYTDAYAADVGYPAAWTLTVGFHDEVADGVFEFTATRELEVTRGSDLFLTRTTERYRCDAGGLWLLDTADEYREGDWASEVTGRQTTTWTGYLLMPHDPSAGWTAQYAYSWSSSGGYSGSGRVTEVVTALGVEDVTAPFGDFQGLRLRHEGQVVGGDAWWTEEWAVAGTGAVRTSAAWLLSVTDTSPSR